MPTETEAASAAPGAVAPPAPKKREDAIQDPLAAAQPAAPQAAAPAAAPAAPATAPAAPAADNPLVAGFQQAFDAPSAASAAVGPAAPPKKEKKAA